jgi:NDP-sugar pyrophosphorylase family protein
VKAVVLVGGEGTRLRPLTLHTPKPLLPIANVAFIERQLDWLGRYGVTEVILSLGYLPDAFIRHFNGDRYRDMQLHYAVEDEPLGTAGAIRFAADGIEERFIVCNGDVLTDLDLGEMIEFHEERRAEASIALTRVLDPSAFGVVPTRDDGEVIAFVEKPPAGKAPSDWINAGTYILEPSVLQRIPPRLNVSVERETFPRMLEKTGRLYALQSEGYWLDIGTPEKYEKAQHDVLLGCVGFPPAPGAVERSLGVWVQGSPEIAPDALLEPPCLIGDGAVIAARAQIANSVVGKGVRVGADAAVRDAILLEGASVPDGADVTSLAVTSECELSLS